MEPITKSSPGTLRGAAPINDIILFYIDGTILGLGLFKSFSDLMLIATRKIMQ